MTPSAAHSPIPLAEALNLWLDGIAMVASERVSADAAVGRILARGLHSPRDFPQTHIALRRGYAVDSVTSVGASAYSPVILMEMPRAVRIGEPIPPGADAVVTADAVSREGTIAEMLTEAAPGENVRRAGEDLQAGDTLRETGEIFRPVDRLIAERSGIEVCEVRVPRLRIVGNDGGVIAAAFARCGGAVVVDADADAIVVIGGSEEFTLLAPALALRPGEEIALGRDPAGRPVLRVPDLPDNLLAVALILIPPLMSRLSGAANGRPPGGPATLTRRISSMVGMSEIVLFSREGDRATPLAIGDLPLSAMARADAFSLVPPEAEGHAAGDVICVFRLW